MTVVGQTRRAGISNLYLASMSLARAKLLRDHGYEFQVVTPSVDEAVEMESNAPAIQLAEALSYFKARSVCADIAQGWILAADTVAVLGKRVFGKPLDRADAGKTLSSLAGTTHEVITGVTLLDAATLRRSIRHDVTQVTMHPLSKEQIDTYLDTGLWEGKAGAYGIQDESDPFVERIDGSFSNVVGLPMELLEEMIAAL